MHKAILEIQKHRALLEMEYNAEKEDFRLQTEKVGIERKIKQGTCWFPITAGRTWYNSLNQLVVEIEQTMPSEIEHSFEYGKPVRFFTQTKDNKIKYFNHPCTVSYAEDARMIVAVPDSQTIVDIQNAEQLGIQLYFDETSFRAMFSALDEVTNAKGNRLAYLRDLFAGTGAPQKFSFGPLSFPWLNKSQEQAVNEVLQAKDVAIVHGPPGTGKTTTLVEAIYETLRRETQVMVCAQSNMAVDWISEKLVDHGINVLRIGNPSRVNDKMLSFTYERRFESHPDYPELWSIRKAIRELRENRKKLNSSAFHQKISRLHERASELEMRINASLFGEARVVACTLVGSSNRLMVGTHFSTLFIDEAAQALEAACWIAIRRSDKVILAGDHQQLPPTIKCFEAQKSGLGVSLMERITVSQPACVRMLKVQYRMNEEIMKFSSDWFYNGGIDASPDVRFRNILDYDIPMVWIDTSDETIRNKYSEQLETIGTEASTVDENAFKEKVVNENSKINVAEAELTMKVLEEYINKISRNRFVEERLDVGIISPYKAQANCLRRLLKKSDFFKPIRTAISINTVDGFQGQERDIIVISLVRSNDSGTIGFLSDLRRMNVAITRARMKLIIIGDASTICHHKFYKELHDYICEEA